MAGKDSGSQHSGSTEPGIQEMAFNMGAGDDKK
jgi:hypothetical protein